MDARIRTSTGRIAMANKPRGVSQAHIHPGSSVRSTTWAIVEDIQPRDGRHVTRRSARRRRRDGRRRVGRDPETRYLDPEAAGL